MKEDDYMIFADKLIVLRKKMGLSQEELADRLDVSRQAVSKWESGQTTPDLEKIIKLSSLFNVSTDYLLKDEIVIEESVKEDNNEHILSLNECKEYITHEKRAAIKLSVATFLCVMCPVALIFLSILSDESLSYISPILAVVIGLSTLFIFVLIAVIIFVLYDNTLSKFDKILKILDI
jgi:transcriptional regulator with XRE-family HTH domain